MRIGYGRASKETNASWASKKLSVGEAFLNANNRRNSLFLSTNLQTSTYQHSMNVDNSTHPPLTPILIKNQHRRSVVDFSKSIVKQFSNAN